MANCDKDRHETDFVFTVELWVKKKGVERKGALVTNGLKSDSHLLKNFIFICFNENPLNMMKNAFYFILKALFVLKIFKFLS